MKIEKIHKLKEIKEKQIKLLSELEQSIQRDESDYRIIGDGDTRFILVRISDSKDVVWGVPSRCLSYLKLRNIDPARVMGLGLLPKSSKLNLFINSSKNK